MEILEENVFKCHENSNDAQQILFSFDIQTKYEDMFLTVFVRFTQIYLPQNMN